MSEIHSSFLTRAKTICLAFSALACHALCKFAGAEKLLSEALEARPDFSYCYGLRAYNRLYLEDFRGARADCDRKLELNPGDASIFSLRARVNFITGRYDDVKNDLERAMVLEPRRRFYHVDSLRLMEAYKQCGDFERLRDFAETCLKPRMEKFLKVEILERRAYAQVELDNIGNALADLNQAIENADSNSIVDLYLQRAVLHEQLGESDLAERDRLNASHWQAHRVRMTEWLPAGPLQRLLAKALDGLIIGLITAFLFMILSPLLSQGIGEIISMDGNSQIAILLNPYTAMIFLVAVLDALFPCLAPVLITLALPELLAFDIDKNALLETITAVLLVMFVNWLYHSLFESSSWQSTPGKSILRLRITDGDGARISFPRATTRHVLRAIPAFVVLFSSSALVFMTLGTGYPDRFFAGAIYLAFLLVGISASLSPGLHNRLAGCLVTDNFLYKPTNELLSRLGRERANEN